MILCYISQINNILFNIINFSLKNEIILNNYNSHPFNACSIKVDHL